MKRNKDIGPPGPPADRLVSDDEKELWDQVMGGVQRVERPKTPARKAPPPPGPRLKGRPRPRPAPLVPVRPEPAAAPLLEHGTAAGVDKRTHLRLKRGQIEIQGVMDLHGLTQVEAHRALQGFIEGAHNAGKRAVLVITGKGLTPGSGVLRDAVPRWLNEPQLRKMILAFSHAQPKDGGEGALYVLVKRKR
jgi:DNA-nicking Smr family endonuclease